MSSQRKHKTSFKKKTTAETYWDDAEPQYTEEQKKRIASYLEENDENCKESTTLILFIVIGLLIALAIVGFLVIRNNSSIKYKGSHTTYEHASSNSTIMNLMWSKWNWLQGLYFGLNMNTTNATEESEEIRAIVALEEELNDFQPIYRIPLLQRLYASDDSRCNGASDDSVYNLISIKHGSWVPSAQYLEEALDFSWSDYESEQEKEEIELVQNLDKKDQTEDDKKEQEALHKQIEADRKKREEEKQKKENKRRLLGQNQKFDPVHALPNPANILMPQNKGDKGAGDVEADKLRANEEELKKQFPNGVIPAWVKQKGILPGGKGVFDRHKLPKIVQQHLKRMDEIMKKNGGKNKTPQDILKGIDLTKFGISKPVNDETSDKEKRADLKKLEEEEVKRHPYMALLTNPGEIADVQCMDDEYRKHEVVFKPMSGGDTRVNDKQSVFNYKSDVLMWYCYLVEIQTEAMNDLMRGGGYFKVNLSFSDVNMEVGFDYVDIYINSMITDSVSGIGRNWEKHDTHPQFVYYMDNEYIERNGNALEVCMKIVTDSSIIKDGFTSMLTVDYDDPQVSKWSKWSECTTIKAGHQRGRGSKNDKHWNGDCGIGVHNKTVTQCVDSGTLNISDASVAPCIGNETRVEYCVKANCYDFPLTDTFPESPWLALKFNGHGRIDPDFPDPFLVQRSTQESFNITNIISELSAVRDQIIARYPDERDLGQAVINHYYMDQSKLRLGIRLARSLLLGDTFTVYTTGSSNTAGHENMFMGTWPIQFQSIMRPVWRRVGYKGAAFVLKNHAEGGSVSSTQIGPCIPSLIGDDADVVYWESQMNDHGTAVGHATENHFRNAITLPRRPLYHVMHAGKNGPSQVGKHYAQEKSKNGKQGQFKNEGSCYGWLCGRDKGEHLFKNGLLQPTYTNYGTGVTLFYPTAGLSSINKTTYEEFQTGYLYISWHPSPAGHRVYAEMLAYYYLTSLLETFADIRDLIEDLTPHDSDTTNKPIEAMLEILEDPPRTKEIPHDHVANQCDPVCTNATEAVCISGYLTLGKPRFSLKRWRQKDSEKDDIGKWGYTSWMKNFQTFGDKKGGQASCDTKMKWETKTKESNELKFGFEAKQYGYITISGDNTEMLINGKSVEMKIYEIDMETGLISQNPQYKEHGKALECGTGGTLKDNWQKENGCTIGGLKPYQKYQIVFNVVKDVTFFVKHIRIY
eukprot:12676_1